MILFQGMPEKESILEGNLGEECMVAEKNAFLEGDEHEETSDEVEMEMHTGKREVDVYSEEGRKELIESGSIECWEEGFSEGAESKGSRAKCRHCGKILSQDASEIVEKRIRHDVFVFCSMDCADKCEAKHELSDD